MTDVKLVNIKAKVDMTTMVKQYEATHNYYIATLIDDVVVSEVVLRDNVVEYTRRHVGATALDLCYLGFIELEEYK